jgi:6-phosphogluconolactonase
MSDWKSFPGSTELDSELSRHIAGQLARDIEQRGSASLAVSGGSTPKGLFRCLSHCELDWSKVSITLVDERWVDRDSPDSNEQLVRDALMQNHAAKAQFIALKTSHDRGEEGLVEARQRIAAMGKPFSTVVLGMGGDGHTASWFPQAQNLQELLDPAAGDEVAVTDPVTAPHQRITLTFPAVLDSREIIVHIVGEGKRAVLESARENGFPIAAVLEQDTTPVTVWWAP